MAAKYEVDSSRRARLSVTSPKTRSLLLFAILPLVAALCPTAAVASMTATSTASADRAAKTTTTMYDGVGFVERPRKLDTRKMGLFDETVIVAKKLHWRHWGTSKATATGRITYCVTEYVPCRTRVGKVVVQGRFLDRCGAYKFYYYKTIRWRARGIKQNADLYYTHLC